MNQTTLPTKKRAPLEAPAPQERLSRLPLWRVQLHNDEVHEMGYVTQMLCQICSLGLAQAFMAMLRAHREGVALVLETHREHAEFIAEQLASAGLFATIEPAHEA